MRRNELGMSFGALPFRSAILVGGRVGMWRGGGRSSISVAAPFGRRCPTSQTIAPFPHPAHRTGRALLTHPALGQALMLSPTAGRACEGPNEPAPDPHGGTGWG